MRNREIRVSVPSFGDSFFITYPTSLIRLHKDCGFRPLIRGFFFYLNGNAYTFYAFDSVSVPSFGDSFFISLFLVGQVFPDHVGFPSPHSGILFLF